MFDACIFDTLGEFQGWSSQPTWAGIIIMSRWRQKSLPLWVICTIGANQSPWFSSAKARDSHNSKNAVKMMTQSIAREGSIYVVSCHWNSRYWSSYCTTYVCLDILYMWTDYYYMPNGEQERTYRIWPSSVYVKLVRPVTGPQQIIINQRQSTGVSTGVSIGTPYNIRVVCIRSTQNRVVRYINNIVIKARCIPLVSMEKACHVWKEDYINQLLVVSRERAVCLMHT